MILPQHPRRYRRYVHSQTDFHLLCPHADAQKLLGQRLRRHPALLDALAVGTDPAQGAALARVVLQALVTRAPRLSYHPLHELKGLPSLTTAFTAAVSFQDGRPTYWLAINAVGLHAFAIAVRMGLPEDLIDRQAAIGENERQWIEEKERAAEEREALVLEREVLNHKIQSVEQDKQALQARLEKIKREKESILNQERDSSHQRIREAEKDIKALIATLQSQPSLRSAGKALSELRSRMARFKQPSRLPKRTAKLFSHWGQGAGSKFGREGIVAAPPKGQKVEIRFGSSPSLVEKHDCVLQKRFSSKAEKRSSSPQTLPLQSTLRTPSNTLDCRGMRVEEAIHALDFYLDQMLQRGGEVAYVLHGHGTGALKKALRDWVGDQPIVESWRPASDAEGGDAFTQIRLR